MFLSVIFGIFAFKQNRDLHGVTLGCCTFAGTNCQIQCPISVAIDMAEDVVRVGGVEHFTVDSFVGVKDGGMENERRTASHAYLKAFSKALLMNEVHDTTCQGYLDVS